MRRSARLPLLLALAGLTAGTAALLPAAAAPTGPPAVTGGAVQAWRATPWVNRAASTKPGGPVLHLTGTPGDELAKLTGSPTAGFGTGKPTGTSTAVQQVQAVTSDNDTTRSQGAAFWEGDWSGPLDGPMSLTLHWTSTDLTGGLVPGDNVAIRVFADPGTKDEKLLGSATDRIRVTGSTSPVAVTSVVQLKGKVAERLLVEVLSLYGDQSFEVHYGSAAAPSSFTLPKKGARAAKLPSTVPVRDDRPLSLAATYINHKASEPTLGVTKKGNAFIAAADFSGPAGLARTFIFGSYDGSKTYQDVTPEVAGQPFPPTTLDPYIYVDQETDRIYSDDLLVGCSLLQWSDDEGKTWSTGNPFACEAPVDDHQTIVVGNPPAGLTTVGYPNVVYYCVNKIADAQCARSLDGGLSFSASGAPAFAGVSAGSNDGEGRGTAAGICGGLHGHIVTDPAGRLYLPKGHCGNPWLAVSEDGGTTWRQTLVHPMATASTHTSVASDKAGNIYYVWWEAETNLPYMAVSRDAGRTFGPALLVGPPGLRGSNFPSVDAGEKGVVALSYPGTLSADEANRARPWNYYVAVSYNALAATPVFHSATANPVRDPIHRGVCLGRCAGMFDFLDVIFSPKGEVWATAVDTCTKACALASLKADTLSGAERPTDAQGVVVRQLPSRKR